MNAKEKRQNDKKIRRKQRVEKRNCALERKREKEDNKIKFSIDPFNRDTVPEQFVVEVTNCLHEIRLNDREVFNNDEEKIFKLMKEKGFQYALADMMKRIDPIQRKMHQVNLFCKMGDTVFKKLQRKNLLLNFIPYNNVDIVPKENEFIVIFRALLKQRSKFGNVFYSTLKPTVKIDNKDYVVAFSRHAIQRICERTAFDWQSYAGAGDAFAYLERCIKFDLIEDINSLDRKKLITFYELCMPGFANMVYVNEVLDKINPKMEYCYRVGYCPVGLNDNFACAITLLTPGMKGTPEDLLIKNSSLSYEIERKIRNGVQDMISIEIWHKKRNFAAIKWFHKNGIPQVLEIKEKLFQDVYRTSI